MRSSHQHALFRLSVFLPLAVLLMILVVFSARAGEAPELTCPVMEDTEFGAIQIGCSQQEFLDAGFRFGDSCDVEISNGFRLEDVAVYNGYYGRSGTAVIVLYPGYEHPGFTYCTSGGMWEMSGATESDTVRVTLRERGKYLSVQESLSTVYSNDRNDYESDIRFANFRPLTGGKLREGMFFRGASPVDNRFNRARTADQLVKDNGVGFILDLADTEETARAYDTYPGSRAAELAENGQVAFLGLTSAFLSEDYGTKLIEGFRIMAAQDAPVYIHCTEGRDRTGFVCMLLEALAGAGYDEMTDDYLITYENYYHITEQSNPDKYAAILDVKWLDLVCGLTGQPADTDFSAWDFQSDAEAYLLRNGMTPDEVEQLELFLTGV